MFKLSVVTPEAVYLERDVQSIVAPGSEGYLGVLTDHAPLLTALIPGRLTVKDAANQQMHYALSGGFLEVSGNVATILADAIESLDEIDIERAKEAEQRARERLRPGNHEKIDVDRAQAALTRAMNRLKNGKHKMNHER